MSIPVVYTNIKLHTDAIISKSFTIVGDKAYFKIKDVEATPAIVINDKIIIYFLQPNIYNLTFTVYPSGCPGVSLPISLETVANPTPDGLNITVTNSHNSITVFGEITHDASFKIYTDANLLRYFESIELCGVLGISNYVEIGNEIGFFDAMTKARFLSKTPDAISLTPFIPYPAPDVNPFLPPQYPNLSDTFPWTEAIIPWRQNQVFPTGAGVTITPPVPSSPNPPYTYNDQYDKFRSVPDSVVLYLGFNAEQVQPDSTSWTIFLTNFEDRGYVGDVSLPKWKLANYQKKTYMSALSIDKLQFYLPKIEAFVNASIADVTIYAKPFTSSFQENVILFFLRIHIGEQDYPEYVVKYFRQFIEFVGIGTPYDPTINDKLLFGNLTSPKIFEYFKIKNTEVNANADKSCIAYWWAQAGLPSESLVFECVHNIVAFSQLTNALYSIIYASLHPTNPLDPTYPVFPNFLTKYASAANSNEKLNVVRESFRLLVPNTASFSLVKPVVEDPEGNRIKSRHVHQDIMIQNTATSNTFPSKPFNYFTYDTTKYASCSTNLDNIVGLPVITNVLASATTSPLDQETVIDTSTSPARPVMPIFPKPTYCPFGLGYRRCAGEVFVYFIMQKLLDKFSLVTFEDRAGTFPLVPIAPFKQVQDSIFIKQL